MNGDVTTSFDLANIRSENGGLLLTLRYSSRRAYDNDAGPYWEGYGDGFPGTFQNTTMGPGWGHNWHVFAVGDSGVSLTVVRNGARQVYGELGDNGKRLPTKDGDGSYITPLGEGFEIHHRTGVVEELELVDPAKYSHWMDRIKQDGPWWRLSKVKLLSGGEYLLTYDDDNADDLLRGLLISVRGPSGRVISLLHEKIHTGATGWRSRLTTVTDPAGKAWQLGYDVNDDYGPTLMLASIADPEGNSRFYQYGDRNRLSEVIRRNGTMYRAYYSGTIPHTVTMKVVNSSGIEEDFGAVTAPASIPYIIPVQQCVEVDEMQSCTTTPRIVWRDGPGQIVDGNGNLWAYSVDSSGRVESETPPQASPPGGVNRITTYGYDDNSGTFGPGLTGSGTGKLRWVQQGDGPKTYKEYDPDTKLVKTRVDATGTTTSYYRQDPRFPGKVTRTTEEASITYYQYDDFGNVTQERVVDTETYQEWITAYATTYHQDGLPGRIQTRTKTDPWGHVTLTTYNVYGNPVSVVVDGILRESSDYDVMGRLTDWTEHRSENPDVHWEYGYDDTGLLEWETVDSNGLNLKTQLGRDGEGFLLWKLYPNGLMVEYEYDHRDRLERETIGPGVLDLTTLFEYDGANHVTMEQDPRGAVTRYTYYPFNLAQTITEADGTAEQVDSTLHWNALQQVTQRVRSSSEGSFREDFHYNGAGQNTVYTIDTNGVARTFQYTYGASSAGCGCGGVNVVKEVDPGGRIVYHRYDGLGRKTMTIRKVGDDSPDPDADDLVETWEYDVEHEGSTHTVTHTNAEGTEERRFLDAFNRVTKRVLDPGGLDETSEVVFDGSAVWQTMADNGNTNGHAYDAAGREIGSWDSEGSLYTLELNGLDQVVQHTDGDGHSTWIDYDLFGRVLLHRQDPGGATQFVWGPDTVTVTDTNGTVTTISIDGLNRLKQRVVDVGGEEATTTYTYNAYDMVTSVTASVDASSSQTTRYFCNGALDIERVLFPDASEMLFGYYASGDVAWRSYGGVTTTYERDHRLDRITRRAYPDGTSDAFSYNKLGQLLVSSNGVAEVVYWRRADGSIYQVDQTVDGVTHTVGLNQVSPTQLEITLPGVAQSVVKAMDLRDRLTSVAHGQVSLINGSTYNHSGLLTLREWGNGITSETAYTGAEVDWLEHRNPNVLLKRAYGHDAWGNKTWEDDQTPGWETHSRLYVSDSQQRTQQVLQGVLNEAKDGIVEWIGSPFPRMIEWVFSHLRIDGVLTDVDGEISEETRIHTDVNELTDRDFVGGPSIDLVWDDRGNLVSDGERTFDHTQRNRLSSVTLPDATVIERFYDGLDNCVLQRVTQGASTETRRFAHGVQGEVLAEFDGDENLQRWFIHGEDYPDPLIMVDLTDAGDLPAGEPEYLFLLKDDLGSVVALADMSGKVVERLFYGTRGAPTFVGGRLGDYDQDEDVDLADFAAFQRCIQEDCPAFDDNGDGVVDIEDYAVFVQALEGLVRPVYRAESKYDLPYLWTGQWYDVRTELYHFHRRAYSASIGWLKRDRNAGYPTPEGGYQDGFNLYTYVGDSLLIFVDPDGAERTKKPKKKIRANTRKRPKLKGHGVPPPDPSKNTKKAKKKAKGIIDKLKLIKDCADCGSSYKCMGTCHTHCGSKDWQNECWEECCNKGGDVYDCELECIPHSDPSDKDSLHRKCLNTCFAKCAGEKGVDLSKCADCLRGVLDKILPGFDTIPSAVEDIEGIIDALKDRDKERKEKEKQKDEL